MGDGEGLALDPVAAKPVIEEYRRVREISRREQCCVLAVEAANQGVGVCC